MKRILFILTVCALGVCAYADDKKPALQIEDNSFFDPTKKKAEESYKFGVEYRLELGYAQHDQRTHELTYPDMYLHGGRIGATFTFLLPIHFSLQTGLLYTILYGKNEQHWRSVSIQATQEESITHRVLEHNLTIPLRMYYTIPLWRQLNLFFYTGPQLHIGLAQRDNIETDLSESTQAWVEQTGIPTESYDRYDDELLRANIQWGLGGGIEWDRYRLQSGYDFGLNNLIHNKKMKDQGRYMSEWGWFISFSYKF